MKRKLTKFSLLLFVSAMFLSSVAQHNVMKPRDNQKSSTVKKDAPISWEKSTKEILFYEDFSDNGFDEWTVMGEGVDNWYAGTIGYAGGEAPEAVISWSPLFTGTSRLVSPIINTSGYSTLSLSFLHFIDSYTGGFWVGVETTSDGGTTWNQVWELFWETGDNYAAFEVLGVNTPDVGSENFQMCLTFEDNSDLFDGWYIDNITLGDVINYDVTPTAILGFEDLLFENDEVMISAEINNYGAEIVSFDVVLEIDDNGTVIFESTKSVSDLAFGDVATVDFDTWTAVEGVNYTATVTTMLSGDENPDNDQITHQFVVFGADTYCIPSADCSWGDGFTDFAWAGIENYESGCSDNGYGVFTGMTASVEIGNSYTATFGTGYSSNFASMWIDFNQDLEFSASERVLTDFPLESGVLIDVDIVIPGYAIPGTTTMRIGANYGDISSPDPCAILTFGEWEDYTIEITGTSISYDAGVVSIDIPNVLPQGNITPKATVKNHGIETISFPVTCSSDGYSSTVNVTDLGSGQDIQLEFENWSATPGNYTLEVVTDLSGDENSANDMLSTEIAIVEFAPYRMVVGEEGTGTWCGWCVRGAVYMDSMAMKYPDTWIGIAVHNGDPMLIEEYDAGIGPLIGWAYPGGIVERAIATDPSTFEAAYLERMDKVAPAGIIVENKSFNTTTGELSFTLTADFIATVTDFRFNAVLVENGVTGTGDGWDQANYYSGGTNGPMGGYEDLPNPVPAEDMVYEHVARAILGGFDGVEGSLPGTINAGETHSYDFTITLSEDWDINHLEIVGMLLDNTTGEIENATIDHLITGVTEMDVNSRVLVYPNPAKDAVRISNIDKGNISIYNLNGQLVLEKQNVKGSCKLDISNLKNGTYIVKAISDTKTMTSKLNIVK